MKIEKGKVELKNEYFFKKMKITTIIGYDEEEVCLTETDTKHNGHWVFMATKDNYRLFVYKENNNYEIHNKGNCIGEQGIIKQWEIMKVLNG